MKKILALIMSFAICLIWVGALFGYDLERKIVGPFCTYPPNTFIKTDTGETGLYLEDENWYALINLTGFKDLDQPFTVPTQFYLQSKDGILASAFAYRADGADDQRTCFDNYIKRMAEAYKDIATIGGSKVSIQRDIKNIEGTTFLQEDVSVKSMTSRSVFYSDFHKGYCFNFHFSMTPVESSVEKVISILKTIRFVDDNVTKAKINKLIYIADRRLQLVIPDTWKYSLYPGEKNVRYPTINLLPQDGRSFKMYVTPFIKINAAIPVEEARVRTVKELESLASSCREKPVIQELRNNDAIIYSFTAVDKDYKPGKPGDYPLMLKGNVAIGGTILYFTVLYSDDTKEVALQAVDMMANVKVISLKKR